MVFGEILKYIYFLFISGPITPQNTGVLTIQTVGANTVSIEY